MTSEELLLKARRAAWVEIHSTVAKDEAAKGEKKYLPALLLRNKENYATIDRYTELACNAGIPASMENFQLHVIQKATNDGQLQYAAAAPPQAAPKAELTTEDIVAARPFANDPIFKNAMSVKNCIALITKGRVPAHRLNDMNQIIAYLTREGIHENVGDEEMQVAAGPNRADSTDSPIKGRSTTKSEQPVPPGYVKVGHIPGEIEQVLKEVDSISARDLRSSQSGQGVYARLDAFQSRMRKYCATQLRGGRKPSEIASEVRTEIENFTSTSVR